jgi:CDGSH-type Zn-finger protein
MATIEPLTDGPLMVKDVAQCRNSRGEAIAVENPFYLCRCGGSGNKPFCDSTHKKIGFKSAREAPPPSGVPSPAPGGKSAAAAAPCVQIKKNGPYLVTGVADLKCDVAPSDPAQYTLCRCGASKTKPYCDGSHRTIGFKDDKN